MITIYASDLRGGGRDKITAKVLKENKDTVDIKLSSDLKGNKSARVTMNRIVDIIYEREGIIVNIIN